MLSATKAGDDREDDSRERGQARRSSSTYKPLPCDSVQRSCAACFGTGTDYLQSLFNRDCVNHSRANSRAAPVDNFRRALARRFACIRVDVVTLSTAWLDELRARTMLSAVIAPCGQADPRRARVEGVLPVPQRKDAELHRQRRQGLLPLLRLRRARRRDPLPHRPSRHAVHGRGQGARGQGRAGRPRARPARRRSGPSAPRR